MNRIKTISLIVTISIVIVIAIIVPSTIISKRNNVTKENILGTWTCITLDEGNPTTIAFTFNGDKTINHKIISSSETKEYVLKYYKISGKKIRYNYTLGEELDHLEFIYNEIDKTLSEESHDCIFIKEY